MTATFKDYYDVLKIPRTASNEEIKKAYHRLAREHHPDLHSEKDKHVRTQRMQEVNEAYAVLSSKEDRTKYDQFGENWKGGAPSREEPPSGRPSEQGSQQQEEAFSDFFRHMFRQGEGRGPGAEFSPGELDIEAVLELSLEEAVKGVERSFSLMVTGLCQNCRGSGRTNKVLCPVCGGVGEVRRQREVKSNIPPGLIEGSRVRLKGQGNESPQGRGDLYLRIHLKADVRFKVDDKNLEMEARVMLWDAALGSEVRVDALDGFVRMRLPKGTHAGTRLRIAGKGLGKTAERGDLFVRIKIDIPDSLTPKTEALMKQWKEENHG